MRRNRIIYRLCLDSMMAALYFILTYVSIRIGEYHITFASLMVILSSLLFGLPDSLMIAGLGEFLNQTLSYGITITTPLWILPPLFRALIISLVSMHFRKKKDRLQNHKILYFTTIVLAGLITSAFNTLATYLDGIIYGYPVNFILLTTLVRFLINAITAVILSLLALPVSRGLEKAISHTEKTSEKKNE